MHTTESTEGNGTCAYVCNCLHTCSYLCVTEGSEPCCSIRGQKDAEARLDQAVAVVHRCGGQVPLKPEKKQQRPHLLQEMKLELKLSGGGSMVALATLVLAAAVCVAPRAASSNGKYRSKAACRPALA